MTTSELHRAVEALQRGGVIAYPTEAVYGLGCDPHNAAAVMRLLALKRRSVHKGLILIASDLRQLKSYLAPVDASLWQRAMSTWPGPVSWLFPARKNVPAFLRGEHATLAVRVTAHSQARMLCEAFGGALVSTSANLAGQAPARSADEVREQFPTGIDYILPGEVNRQAKPSEIRDVQTGEILRPG
jgi:L-threonylcarbamoyladenylate synthase